MLNTELLCSDSQVARRQCTAILPERRLWHDPHAAEHQGSWEQPVILITRPVENKGFETSRANISCWFKERKFVIAWIYGIKGQSLPVFQSAIGLHQCFSILFLGKALFTERLDRLYTLQLQWITKVLNHSFWRKPTLTKPGEWLLSTLLPFDSQFRCDTTQNTLSQKAESSLQCHLSANPWWGPRVMVTNILWGGGCLFQFLLWILLSYTLWICTPSEKTLGRDTWGIVIWKSLKKVSTSPMRKIATPTGSA